MIGIKVCHKFVQVRLPKSNNVNKTYEGYLKNKKNTLKGKRVLLKSIKKTFYICSIYF